MSCAEESRRVAGSQANETCSEAFAARGWTCPRLYAAGFRCCLRCDPCGHDGNLCAKVAAPAASAQWISPQCACDQVVVAGACSYKGCAKPDALGVFSRRVGWRTPEGRHVYVKDKEQPGQGLHSDALYHRAYDDSSGAHRSVDGGVYLYYLREAAAEAGGGRWVVGPRMTLDDDVYARSSPTAAPCPTAASAWSIWWGGGVSPLASRTLIAGGLSYYPPSPRGWLRPSRYPLMNLLNHQ